MELEIMTVGEKSTEIGYSLADKVLDNTIILKEECPVSGFVCFKIEAPIPPDDNQRGSIYNCYYYKSEGLLEDSTEEKVKADYTIWLNSQDYIEKPIKNTTTPAFN